MITFPIAKINLGLNVVEKRTDGYHNLQTVFYPVPIMDALEIVPMGDGFPSAVDCDLKVTNIHIEGDEQRNLVVRAAYMIRLLNEAFDLQLSDEQMQQYAARLGADCAFFIQSRPCYAEGIGEKLTPIDLDLKGWTLCVVRPDIPVPTKEAFSRLHPHYPAINCREAVCQPVETWRETLVNDFEESVFALHPEIGAIKEKLYKMGATYAAMSGSGSALFGLFREEPAEFNTEFAEYFHFSCVL